MRGMAVPTRRVLLAKPRGYCAGVDRAVQTVEMALERYGAPVYVRKQIVHNKHVVASLEKRGAVFVEETADVPEGAVVVFSAHGVAPQVRADAKARNLHTIDATCPLVTKVHSEARRFAAQGYDILLIGHEGHEEVVGTTGEAPSQIQLVDGPGDGAGVQVRDPAKVVWLSQTTLSVDETNETVAALRERFPTLADPPSDDICYATQNRQAAVKQIAAESDVVIVVGSQNSSNSVRLVEVAVDAGARAAYLVDDAGSIDPAWLEGATTVGLSSGASVPEDLVAGVLEHLAASGFDQVEEVEAVEERMFFALPHELRPEKACALRSGRRRVPAAGAGSGREAAVASGRRCGRAGGQRAGGRRGPQVLPQLADAPAQAAGPGDDQGQHHPGEQPRRHFRHRDRRSPRRRTAPRSRSRWPPSPPTSAMPNSSGGTIVTISRSPGLT